MEDVSVLYMQFIRKNCQTLTKGYDMVTEIPKYDNVTTRLCKEKQNVLGTEQNPEDISKTVFSEGVLRRANNSSFL